MSLAATAIVITALLFNKLIPLMGDIADKANQFLQ